MSDKPGPEDVYEALERLPENVVGEIIDGELYVSPRPALPHMRAGSRLLALLGPFDLGTEGLGGWIILAKPELRVGPRPDVLVPDLAGWRRERLPELPMTANFRLAPDWVCEVLSPSTEMLDRNRKMGVYAREGVNHLWFIDPRSQTLEVYRLQGGDWLKLGVHTGNAVVHAEPFEALALKLAPLWEW
ncbi:Uma2 family endonuclease [Pyxidicoccus fallax]|uniref:Uma2 family endonuclease n=1 Tax=Pyxidicoccus fallax TaxID=394095 RepID=A0A848LRZ5_9BACT|nr:Uma2 family endonuclease [Pyxidicoccus fallax]NMO20461.1 Uma2 family endonuclease [Pyxidicoccus fallax]NPC86795.1 Uma2 family endonuclease [Pyxidicoccus fallax]